MRRTGGEAIPILDSAGVAVGFCVWASTWPCYRLHDGSAAAKDVALDSARNVFKSAAAKYTTRVTSPEYFHVATHASRTYFRMGDLRDADVWMCYDGKINNVCSNFPFQWPRSGEVDAHSLAVDPSGEGSCVWALGDKMTFVSFSARSPDKPCRGKSPEIRVIPGESHCGGIEGNIMTWDSISLRGALVLEGGSARVTVRDEAGLQITGLQQRRLDTRLSLNDLPVSGSTSELIFEFAFEGAMQDSFMDDSQLELDVRWTGGPVQACIVADAPPKVIVAEGSVHVRIEGDVVGDAACLALVLLVMPMIFCKGCWSGAIDNKSNDEEGSDDSCVDDHEACDSCDDEDDHHEDEVREEYCGGDAGMYDPCDSEVDHNDYGFECTPAFGACPVSWSPDVTVSSRPGESDCILSCALFRLPLPAGERGATFTEGLNLARGAKVLAADNVTELTVVSIESNMTDTLVELCVCDPFIMYDITTPSHHVLVPGRNSQTPYEDVQANSLRAGDLVICSDDQSRKLLSVREVVKPGEVEVLKIVFEPDMPVAVFKPPLTILTKGNKKKKLRRGQKCKKSETANDSGEQPTPAPNDTINEHGDYLAGSKLCLKVKNTFIDAHFQEEEGSQASGSARWRSSSAPL